jgi:hypothetical protein
LQQKTETINNDGAVNNLTRSKACIEEKRKSSDHGEKLAQLAGLLASGFNHRSTESHKSIIKLSLLQYAR